MGKKYIVEIGRLERLYKAYVNGNGKPNITWLSPEVDLTPYTAPDLEQVRKEAYDKAYADAVYNCSEGCSHVEQVRQKAYKEGVEDGKRLCPVPEVCNDMAYQKGLSDAWEAARTLWNTPNRKEIFGNTTFNTVLTTLTAQEVIEKIRQYEQEKEEIQVGDEVVPRETEYDDMIVTRLWKDDYDSDCIDAIGFDGRISSFLVSRVSKTGKHYEIATVLEKMRGEQDG